MKSAGLRGILSRRFRRTTDSNHAFSVADNLVKRRFKPAASKPSQAVWAGDITYLRTGDSRRIVGWSMDTTMQCRWLFERVRIRTELQRHGPISSMIAKGNCYDNAVVESFFGTLKSELGDPVWKTHGPQIFTIARPGTILIVGTLRSVI